MSNFDIEIIRFDSPDPRLGRHVRHDSRSLAYKVEPAPMAQLASVDHSVNIGVLDQGALGSCTGNAATANLATADFWTNYGHAAVLDETYAVALYSAATRIDPYAGEYPPNDTGSDGLSVAKALQSLGVVDRYEHATSLEATLTALQTQAVITGVSWHQDSYYPLSDGRLRISGPVVGGHEFLLHKVDMERERIWMRNSWGPGWGIGGGGYFTFDDFASLLADYGDVTVMHSVDTLPEPTPVPTDDAATRLRTALTRFLETKGCPDYLRTPATDWMES